MAASSAESGLTPPAGRPRVLTPDGTTWAVAQHGHCLLRAVSPSLKPRATTDFTACGAVAIKVKMREVQSEGAAEVTVSPGVDGEEQPEAKRPKLATNPSSAVPDVTCTLGCGQWWTEMAPPVMPNSRADHAPNARGISLAAVVAPLDQHGRVLLTRRPRHMRTFPGCWVLPGGSVDPGESTLAAALRELQEETGLLPAEPSSAQPFALWEVRVLWVDDWLKP